MEENIKNKTGRSVAEWIGIVKKTGIDKHSAIIKHLKAEYGFTHGYANFVALKSRAADSGSQNEEDLINNQYKGKEQLKTICDNLLAEAQKFGNDVEIAPKKANISLRRKKQFALVQPSTKTRIDLGLKLKGKEPSGRLENSGPFGSMCTHRVRLQNIDEIDQEVLNWLKEAYDEAN